MSKLRLLVSGGREFSDVDFIVYQLDRFHRHTPVGTLIVGDARGLDKIARFWANEMGVDVKLYRAEWDRFGKQAGPMRNERMLYEGNPDAVLVFPGNRGTGHMWSIAHKEIDDATKISKLYFKKESPDWGFLSNFHQEEFVDHDGCFWQTSEHYYQSRKTLDETERSEIQNTSTPNAAKKLGNKVSLRDDWEDIKNRVMMDTLRLKFHHNTELSNRLIASDVQYLVEYAPWGDTYWGVDKSLDGLNILGKLLMKRREELKDEPNTDMLYKDLLE